MGLTKIGNKSIIKKMFGNKEILKEVCDGVTVYQKVTVKPYLRFYCSSSFNMAMSDWAKGWDGTLEYSKDTETWSTWTGERIYGNVTGEENKYNLYLRGTGNTYISKNADSSRGIGYLTMSTSGSDVYCEGNIETLLDYATVVNGQHPTMDVRCFKTFFYNCSVLKSAPDLGAEILTESCYYGTFWATGIIETPFLPASIVPRYAYGVMFAGCPNLTTFKGMAATSIGERSCYQMFQQDTALVNVPNTLPALTIGDYGYSHMFLGCTALTKCMAIAATSMATYACEYMYRGCTALNNVTVLLPTGALSSCQYCCMYYGCSNIKVNTSRGGIYQNPFRIPRSGTCSDPNSNAVAAMFMNTGGAFTSTPNLNYTYYLSNQVVVPDSYISL